MVWMSLDVFLTFAAFFCFAVAYCLKHPCSVVVTAQKAGTVKANKICLKISTVPYSIQISGVTETIPVPLGLSISGVTAKIPTPFKFLV